MGLKRGFYGLKNSESGINTPQVRMLMEAKGRLKVLIVGGRASNAAKAVVDDNRAPNPGPIAISID